jgi:hypothetical protein
MLVALLSLRELVVWSIHIDCHALFLVQEIRPGIAGFD